MDATGNKCSYEHVKAEKDACSALPGDIQESDFEVVISLQDLLDLTMKRLIEDPDVKSSIETLAHELGRPNEPVPLTLFFTVCIVDSSNNIFGISLRLIMKNRSELSSYHWKMN